MKLKAQPEKSSGYKRIPAEIMPDDVFSALFPEMPANDIIIDVQCGEKYTMIDFVYSKKQKKYKLYVDGKRIT